MEIVKAAASLSGGTLATLTDLRRYDELDAVQAAFTGFCRANASRFETWAQAWNAFTNAGFPGWTRTPVA